MFFSFCSKTLEDLPSFTFWSEGRNSLLWWSKHSVGFKISIFINLFSSSSKYLWHIIPLHSSITRKEQNQVFQLPSDGYRKVILSTNIAESSITVPDVEYGKYSFIFLLIMWSFLNFVMTITGC